MSMGSLVCRQPNKSSQPGLVGMVEGDSPVSIAAVFRVDDTIHHNLPFW